jgi:outer membrane protein OmpA-like peptidoglycan-associated protein
VRIESDGHLVKLGTFTISPRQTTQLELALMPKPAKAGVVVRGTNIAAPAVKFAGDSTDLDAPASAQLAEVADLLLRSPDIRRVRIEGSGDDALALTRALMIKQRLVDLGVEETRLEATGGSGGARVKLTVVNE